MDNKVYTINGVIQDKRDGGNTIFVLNGDIETNSKGQEIYITDTIEGKQSRLVKDLPLEIQSYIKNNKVLKSLPITQV